MLTDEELREHRYTKKIVKILRSQTRRSAKALYRALLIIQGTERPRNINGTKNVTEAGVRMHCKMLAARGFLKIHGVYQAQTIYILGDREEEVELVAE